MLAWKHRCTSLFSADLSLNLSRNLRAKETCNSVRFRVLVVPNTQTLEREVV